MAKRIRPAKHYQRADNPVRAIVLQNKPKVRRDLREAFSHLSVLVPQAPVVRMIRNGRWREIADTIDFGHYREILKKPFARIADAYQAGAQHGVRKINGAFGQARRRVRFRKADSIDPTGSTINNIFFEKASDVFNFDMFDANTQASLRQAQDDLIQQLEQSARDAIEVIVLDGAQNGLGAEEIASDIRDLIGLTDTQAQAVLNFRNMLEGLDSGALTRQLRNQTWDQTIQDAIDNDEMIASDVIDQMVSDYTDNYLDYRADTISQTESVRAANEGLHDAYSQAIDRGALPDGAVTREWELGDSPCPICESIPDNNPDGVGVDEQFDSDDGPVDDPPVHPNACFSGTPFRSYGSLKRIVRAQYKGPAISLTVCLQHGEDAAAWYAGFAEYLDQASARTMQSDSSGDLLVRNHRGPTVSVAPRLIRLTIGPNHPMLTRRGFVPARELDETDELLYDARAEFALGSGEVNFKEMPAFDDAFATLANAFETISPAGPRSYFHGDEVFTYGEVDIVFPERGLLPVWDSGGVEHLCECPLMRTYTDAAHVACCGACQQRFGFVFRSASGAMRGTKDHLLFGFSQPIPSFFHCARIVASHWTTFRGFAFDASTSNAIYNAGGLIVKNCMCSVNYVTDISQVPDDSGDSGSFDTNTPLEGVG